MARRRDRGQRPRRLFRARRERLWGRDPASRRLIDAYLAGLTAAERARAEAVIDGCDDVRFWAYFARVASEHERAGMVMALKTAYDAIADARPCDLCPSKAVRVRFLFLDRELRREGAKLGAGQGLMAFTLLCPACHTLPEREFERRSLDGFKARHTGPDPWEPPMHPTLVGPRVGQGGPLAGRRVLENCSWCGSLLWLGTDEHERILRESSPQFVCGVCASDPPEGRTIEAVAVPSGPFPP
jgi:hypothetical protein